jgi:4'-phosphopantetheinyl transferase
MLWQWPSANGAMDRATEAAHVWAVPLNMAVPPDDAADVLSVPERARCEQFRLAEPRRRFALSRIALRKVLAQYLQVEPGEIDFTEDARRKPQLAGRNAGSKLQFNVAHSQELALIAVASGPPIGVDVEHLRPVSHWQQVAERHFHSSEVHEIGNCLPEERMAAFLRCWTAKEAVLKTTGLGLSGSMAAFHVPVVMDSGAWVHVPVLTSAEAQRFWLAPLAPAVAYVAAVAILEEERPIRCFSFAW